MISSRLLIIIILGMGLLVGFVHADAGNPPASVHICGYVSYDKQMGVWWFNPPDTDYLGVQIYVDDVYLTTTTLLAQHFYDFNSSVMGIHVFSTHSVDTFGNVNSTWVNLSLNLDVAPVCNEGWFCPDGYCTNYTGGVITPTVTETPPSWINQTFNATTDICHVTADMGETWIKWDANCNTTVEVLYYLDGVKLENTTPYEKLDPNRLILSDLHSGETHNLKIYYLGNVIVDSKVTTLPSWYMILFFIVVSLALSLTGLLFVRLPVFRIIIGTVAFSIAVWVMTMSTGWMLAVPVIPALFAVILIIMALYDQVNIAWGG
jgi:hypothetical protein